MTTLGRKKDNEKDNTDVKLEVLANKIKQVKNNLNELVYKLYNITEEEKKIIESSL